MKRLFVFFSIILLLGSNIAMSMDTDCLLIQQFQSDHTVDQDNDLIDIDYSDDCCHSTSHFVGIYPDSTYKSPIVKNHFVQLHFGLFSSQFYQPAIPPPNV